MKGFQRAPLAALATAALLAVTAVPARAIPVKMHTAGTVVGNQVWSSVGLDFDVNPGRTITVQELGVYDDGSDNIAGGITLTTILFDANTQTPIVQMNFALNDPGMWMAHDYLFKPLDNPLTLGPGRYTLASYGFDELNRLHNSNIDGPRPVFDGGGAVTFYQSVWGGGADLPPTYPTTTFGPAFPDFFDGPNMIFEAVPIPVPGALLLGAGGTGLVGCLRRRMAL